MSAAWLKTREKLDLERLDENIKPLDLECLDFLQIPVLSSKIVRMRDPISTQALLSAIRRLSPDSPVNDPKKWYTSQKEHWLGWLGEYQGPGAYGRVVKVRDAQYAYNHIVEFKMLLYLARAAGVNPSSIAAAELASAEVRTPMQKSGAIRSVIPWETVAAALWENYFSDSGQE